MRRNARGLRPSWRSTMSRSSTLGEASVRVQPAPDAAHDEELLARLDEAEAPRLAGKLGVARRRGDEALQLLMLPPQPLHLRGALRDGLPRVHVRARRLVIEEPDDRDRADRDPDAQRLPARTARSPTSRHDRFFAAAASGPTPCRP